MQTGKKTVTIYDVAKRAGVSIATVSRTFNTPDKVNPETRNRILEAIDALEFVPKAEARARALSQTNRIGVLTPFFTEPSFVQRLRGIGAALSRANFELVIYTIDSISRLKEYLTLIPLTGNLDGLIIISLPVSEEDIQRVTNQGIEVVLIEYAHPDVNSIEINDFRGGQMAANHFIQKGHKRIAFIGAQEPYEYSIHPTKLRYEGFSQELAIHGLEISPQYAHRTVNTSQDALQAAKTLLTLPEPPTAIFAAADVYAFSVLKVAKEMEVNIPKDLAVIGFDDIDFAEYFDLTTIRQHLDESGRLAVELLLAHLEDPTRPPQHINLSLQFVQRHTA